jgi:predicted transcriptional regulator
MKLTDAEWTVMGALWERAPASARDVLEAVGDETGWAYTTVKTMLARLAEKGVLAVEMDGNTSRYSPLVTRGDARKGALRALVEHAFDGTVGALVSHLVAEEKLSAKDRRRLAELAAELEREAGARTRRKRRKP